MTKSSLLCNLLDLYIILSMKFDEYTMSSLKKDDATGLNTGIGFCEFYDKQTADEARKMNNKKSINGRAIRIDNPDGGKKGTAAVVRFVGISESIDSSEL